MREAEAHGGLVLAGAGFLLAATGLAGPWNPLMVHEADAVAHVGPVLGRLRAERGVDAGVMVPEELADATRDALTALGLREVTRQALMTAELPLVEAEAGAGDPNAPADALPDTWRVERVSDEADLAAHVTAQLAAFGGEPGLLTAYLRPLRDAPHSTLLTGWVDGEPVASGMLALEPGTDVAGIFGIGVAPTARRRGLGSAMTASLCRIAAEAGATLAFLNPSDMAAGVYRWLGFADAPGTLIWLRTGSCDG